jgi:hypothetical protein
MNNQALKQLSLLYSLAWVLLIFLPSIVRADLQLCDGTWTNKDCSSKSTVSLPATKSSKSVDPKTGIKKSLFHQLDMKHIKARDDFDISIDISEATDICDSEESSVAQCRASIEKLEDRLDAKIIAAQTLAAQQRANELKAKELENDSAKTPVVIINKKTNILVTDDNFQQHKPREIIPVTPSLPEITLPPARHKSSGERGRNLN